MPANANFDPSEVNMSELEQLRNDATRYKNALNDIIAQSFDVNDLSGASAKGRLSQVLTLARTATDPSLMGPGSI